MPHHDERGAPPHHPELGLEHVLQEVVNGARSLTDARYGAVGVLDDPCRIREFIPSGDRIDELATLHKSQRQPY